MAEPRLADTNADQAVYRDRQLVVTRTSNPPGLRFVGELDLNNSHAISHALQDSRESTHNPHMDLRGLIFCDVSAIRALVNIARLVGPDRRLLLHGLPEDLERVIRVTGWSEEPGLSFCGCTEGEQ